MSEEEIRKMSDQILRELRKVSIRVDTHIAKVNHHIKSTKLELERRKKRLKGSCNGRDNSSTR